MASSYELWLLDDTGRRIVLLQNMSFFAYSRSTHGLGTFEAGFPFEAYRKLYPPIFQPDLRVDVWRSPREGIPMRREGMYLLRMQRVYTREEDAMDIIVLYGRDLKDLLNRRIVAQAAGTAYTRKSDNIDDIMKAIVREQFLYGTVTDVDMAVDNTRALPNGEFFVQPDQALGPTYTKTFAERNVMDILRELHDASRQLYYDSPLVNKKIYFNIVPVDIRATILYILDEETGFPIEDASGNGYLVDESSSDANADIGFRFETYAGLFGQDRTDGLVFSKENNNVRDLAWSISHLDEKNSAIIKGFGRGDSREWTVVDNTSAVNASRWNRVEVFVDASTEPDQTRLDDFGYPALESGRPEEKITATFLNIPVGPDTPESLYGIQWDLGDLLPVYYFGRQFDVEVDVVYVGVDENGVENITGRNEVDNASN